MSVSQYTDLSSWGSWRTCCIPPQPPQGCSLSQSWPAWSGWGSPRWRPWTWGGRSSGHSTKKIKTLWLAVAGLQIPRFFVSDHLTTPHMHTMLVSMELGLSSSVLVEMGWVSEIAVRLWRFLLICDIVSTLYKDEEREPVMDHPEAIITAMRGKLQPTRLSLHSKGWVIKECILQIRRSSGYLC